MVRKHIFVEKRDESIDVFQSMHKTTMKVPEAPGCASEFEAVYGLVGVKASLGFLVLMDLL